MALVDGDRTIVLKSKTDADVRSELWRVDDYCFAPEISDGQGELVPLSKVIGELSRLRFERDEALNRVREYEKVQFVAVRTGGNVKVTHYTTDEEAS